MEHSQGLCKPWKSVEAGLGVMIWGHLCTAWLEQYFMF